MTWNYYDNGEEFILKEDKEISKNLLDTLNPKEKKKLKKQVNSASPTEFFGQDFTKLGDLIIALKEINFIKSDDKLKKKMKSMDERNVDIVATASKLRKEYELLYRQLRDLVYPPKKGEKKMTEENKVSNDILAILKALTDKIETLERTVYAKDNLLMKSGLVVSQSPTPSMDNKISSPVGDVGSMDWKDIHKMVENVGGQ